jgi:ribokinase
MTSPSPIDVLVVGSCMTDLLTTAVRLPRMGETLIAERFTIGFGGKGANQAVQIARLDGRVAMIARVGDDDFGRGALENFTRQAVDARFVALTPGVASGVAPITVAADGSNTVLIVPGANMTLSAADVQAALTALGPAPVILAQLEIPDDAIRAAFAYARASSARAILNPAPARVVAEDVLALADVLIPNETELAALTGMDALSDLQTVAAAARALRRRPDQAILVTLGERGVWLDHDGDARLITAPATRAVDTTGAGDAFVGTFALLLSRGMTLAAAAEAGCRVAAASVERLGTQTSFIDAGEAERRGVMLRG